MSESTLALGYTDFQREVGRLSGYGATYSSWSAAQTSEIDDIIQSGLRQFYFPPAIEGKVHDWNFLKPWGSITTITDYSTGTVSSSSTTVTLTTGTWPSWAATNGTLVVDNIDYAIASRTSNSIIVLSSAPSSPFSSDTFTLEHNNNYTLSDDFGVLDGPLVYASDKQYCPIDITSDKIILSNRAIADTTAKPYLGAIKFLNSTSQTAGQRYELMLYPRADDVYILSFPYKPILNKISSTLPYAYGSGMHSETLLESILAIWEQRGDNKIGEHTQKWMERLKASVEMDACQVPDVGGYNRDNSDIAEMGLYFRDTAYGAANHVTYNNLS